VAKISDAQCAKVCGLSVSFTWRILLTAVDVTDYGHEMMKQDKRHSKLSSPNLFGCENKPQMQLKTFWQQFIASKRGSFVSPAESLPLPQAGQLSTG